MMAIEKYMTTQPQPDAHSAQLSAETEPAVRDFLRAAVSRLSDSLKNKAPEWEADSRWERGTDGHFREGAKRKRTVWPILTDEWLRSVPEYDTCVEHLRCDPVVGSHLDRLVGTNHSATLLNPNRILLPLIYELLNPDRDLASTDNRFDCGWRELVGFFAGDRIKCKMVAPLPYLVLPTFPLRLNDEIVLDRLTEDEVTRCCQISVLRLMPPGFPFISSDVAVGVRRTMLVPKLIRTGEEPQEPPKDGDEGSFGSRPLLQDDLVIDDVLSALRLFKHTRVRSAGHVSWTDSPWLKYGTSYRVLGQWPYGSGFELSESELPQFLELWRLLEEGAARFGFSIHRFNLAFDRGLLADRIVDMVIAAESLFLGDLDVPERGELRFRFALRAAKFIEHPVYGERELFHVMRRAYDARSAIVHGGSPKDTRLPDNKSANLSAFIDAIEELVRLGLCKGLSMGDDGKKLRQAEYWEDLLLSKPNQ